MMLKRVMLTFAAATLLAGASTAGAQTMQSETSSIDFGILGGVTFPMGDLGDFTKTGWHLGGLVGWKPATMPVGFRFDLAYHGLAGKDINTGTGTVEGPDARIIFGTANVELDLSGLGGSSLQSTREPGTMAVYLTGGVGIYNADVDAPGVGSSTDFGINVGGGVNFNLAGMRSALEAKFHNVFSDGSSARFIPISFLIRFGGPRPQ